MNDPISTVSPLDHQEENHIVVLITRLSSPPPVPYQPCLDLVQASSKEDMEVCLQLYKAAIRGDWMAAEPILYRRPGLVRFAITKNYDTLLHVAASAQNSKALEEFVVNLVKLMDKGDLELQNKSCETALSYAAAAGNMKIAREMICKNGSLIDIPDKNGDMPLYLAALFERRDMVRYLYGISSDTSGDLWDDGKRRRRVLEKCVEAEVFDSVTFSCFQLSSLLTILVIIRLDVDVQLWRLS